MIEKKFNLGLIGVSFIAGGYMLIKGGNQQKLLTKDQIIEKREQLLQDKNIRMLYSTMTFFYLYGYQQDYESLFKLYDILQIAKPQIVSLNITKDDYEENYKNLQLHPKFKDTMIKVDYFLKMKSDEIKKMKEITLDNLESIYLIDYCNKNKCQLVFQNQDQKQLQQIQEAKLKVQAMLNEQSEIKPVNEMFENQYVNNILKSLQPKYKFFPTSPYKTIVGLANNENLEGISNEWKQQFKQTYGHQVIEDQS